LVLLPLPVAPPFFLALFLLSLTLHARPCFYCIVLLTALFLSTCYWPPVPIETPLTQPWSENITTYADALLSLMPNLSEDKVPSDIPIADHCWCDLTSGKFFEPFDMSRWEVESLVSLRDELEMQEQLMAKLEEAERVTHDEEVAVEGQVSAPSSADSPVPLPEKAPTPTFKWPSILATMWPFLQAPDSSPSAAEVPQNSTSVSDGTEPSTPSPSPSDSGPSAALQPVSSTPQPRLRREYDLRPYGFEMVVDFGWTRRKS